jgi:hypothetical protein
VVRPGPFAAWSSCRIRRSVLAVGTDAQAADTAGDSLPPAVGLAGQHGPGETLLAPPLTVMNVAAASATLRTEAETATVPPSRILP